MKGSSQYHNPSWSINATNMQRPCVRTRKHGTASDCKKTMVRDSGEKKQYRKEHQKEFGFKGVWCMLEMLGVIGEHRLLA